MSGVPFSCRASGSIGSRRSIVHRPNIMDTDRPGTECANHQDGTDAEDLLKESPPRAESSAQVGTKRPCGVDQSEDRYRFASNAGELCLDPDSVSVIVRGTKKIRISDRADDDRDTELRRSLIEKHQEKQEPVLGHIATQTITIPEMPSLSGLSEELILKILQELTVTDTMTIRRTNKRLAYVTRARILWIKHLCELFAHVTHSHFTKFLARCIPSQVPSRILEHFAVRPYIFEYKWLRSRSCHQNPVRSRILSTSWSEPEHIRCPILMPTGRWLIATYDDERSFNSSICLWDLDLGTLKWLPVDQMVAEGKVFSLDMKMDRAGGFAFLAVLSEKENVNLVTRMHQVDVYKVVFYPGADASSFHHIDSLPLETERALEVQMYPQHGRVIVDLFDRVLFWDYAPVNMCALLVTGISRRPRRGPRAITHTHRYLFVADGFASVLRIFNIPPPIERPAHLRDLPLFLGHPHLALKLPKSSVSLRFSTERLVEISSMLETPSQRRKAPVTLPLTVQSATVGTNVHVAHMGINSHQGEHDRMRVCFEPSGRGFLFIDAASCDSYHLCSFPIHEIDVHAGSSNTLTLTSIERGDARKLALSGSCAAPGATRTTAQPSLAPIVKEDRDSSGIPSALWVGTLGGISSALTGDSNTTRLGRRNVVLLQDPDYDGLFILSTITPPTVDLGPNQSRIAEIKQQDVAKGVLRLNLNEIVGARTQSGIVRVEAASVDEISGRVCIVETIAVTDRISNAPKLRWRLRLLEYA